VPAKKNADGHDRGRLVIVESPAKAKTIAGYLGPGYVVESSVGHIRDLPTKRTEIPEAQRARYGDPIGVDVEHGFEPLYIVPQKSKAQVKKLKGLLKNADELYLATDEDREGEAIAWHLEQELKPKVPVKRMVFHEITPDAIQQAVESPRGINTRLVDAQETRRIVDRLFGYEVSPVLWRKVTQGLSAGRVQSVATRLVVDRERERMAFRSAEYWDLEATLTPGDEDDRFDARLVTLDGTRIAQGRDFGSDGQLKAADKVVRLDEEAAHSLAEAVRGKEFRVRSVEAKPYRRSPYAPFRTTTLQQEAARKLSFGAARTMQVAQRLYENGFITYMRTDSITLSEDAIAAARAQVRELYGAEYLPDAPRIYSSKVKNAQEAHEAIRPAGHTFRTPGQTGLTGDEFRLYELIWMRTVASQMRDAVGQTVNVRIEADAATGNHSRLVEFSASGKTITFFGFLKAYVEGVDDPDAERDDRERKLPTLVEGQELTALDVRPEGHTTKPPARYTEASLVKELEDREIGRPSTYATIIRTILDRGYVFKRGPSLVPSWLAFAVTRLLETHFSWLVDYEFTARMEDVLDEIAAGEAGRVAMLQRFWSGGGGLQGLKPLVDNLGDIDARAISSFDIGDGYVVRVGRYGPFVEDTDGRRGSVPPDLPPDELTPKVAKELIERGNGERELGTDPETGHLIVAKDGRYGPYVTEVLPEDAPKKQKPRTASLLSSQTVDAVTLSDALQLLSLPRVVGVDDDGNEITAAKGRYGPYLKKGTDYRTLGSDDEIFTVTLDRAKEIFAQPKLRRGQMRAAAAPLRELGDDPETKKPIVIRDGRFGPYLTDGTTNVTVPRSEDIDSISRERAVELLAEKRAKGPTPRKTTRSRSRR
jgi:DNA topoisomerase I